jgi:HlyD family secretion protein
MVCMHNNPVTMIRDTAGTDRVLAPPARRIPRPLLIGSVIGAVVLLLALGAPPLLRWLSVGNSVSASRLRIAQVHRGKLVRDVNVQGRVVAAVSPTLYASAAGTVTLKINAGDKVEKDQVLAEVESPELQNRLAQEQATRQSLEIEVERTRIESRKKQLQSQKAVDQAEVDRVAAAREVERNEQAFTRGAIAELTVLRAKDGAAKADLTLNQAKQDLALERETLDFELKAKGLQLDRQRLLSRELERQVETLKVRAPVSGQIGTLLVAQKANVPANAPLLTVVDLSALELEVQIPENYARELALDMPAEVHSGSENYRGAVSAISPEVVNGQVTGRVRFDTSKPAGLRQNQRLSARIVMDERPDVLLVERGSFLDTGAGRSAYVVHDGVAERRKVTMGAAGLEAVEVLDGLKVGDQVVIGGSEAFGDAERVMVH